MSELGKKLEALYSKVDASVVDDIRKEVFNLIIDKDEKMASLHRQLKENLQRKKQALSVCSEVNFEQGLLKAVEIVLSMKKSGNGSIDYKGIADSIRKEIKK